MLLMVAWTCSVAEEEEEDTKLLVCQNRLSCSLPAYLSSIFADRITAIY